MVRAGFGLGFGWRPRCFRRLPLCSRSIIQSTLGNGSGSCTWLAFVCWHSTQSVRCVHEALLEGSSPGSRAARTLARDSRALANGFGAGGPSASSELDAPQPSTPPSSWFSGSRLLFAVANASVLAAAKALLPPDCKACMVCIFLNAFLLGGGISPYTLRGGGMSPWGPALVSADVLPEQAPGSESRFGNSSLQNSW
jgi:hypothetical protein